MKRVFVAVVAAAARHCVHWPHGTRYIWAEGLLVVVAGCSIGFATGFGLAEMLVKLLTGVFDPSPEHLAVPWSYLAAVIVAGAISMCIAVLTVARMARTRTTEALRSV